MHTLDEIFVHVSVFMYHLQGKTICKFLKNQMLLLSSYLRFLVSVAFLT